MVKKIKIRHNPIRKWLIAGGIIVIIFVIGFVAKPMVSSWIANTQNHFSQSGNQASSFFSRLFLSGRVFKENESLKQTNQDLVFKITQLENVKTENKELRKILDLGLQKEFTFIDAYVYGKNINADSVYINKGDDDGVKVGSVIVNSSKILIGRVSKTFKNNSLVSLITSSQIKTNVEVGDSRVEAIAKGKGNLELSIENLPQDKGVKFGDVVSTGKLQNEYPAGLPLGTVKSVKITDLDPFQTALVEPYFNFNNLGLVLVITEF
jgi:rod shape-determining protein MreC